MNNIRGIKCIAPLFDASGYGDWGRSYIVALIKAGIPVTLTVPTFESSKPDLGELYDFLVPYVNKPVDYNVAIAWLTPDVAVNFLNAESSNILKINFTLWETTKLPESWVGLLNNSCNECWLPGEWNAQVFQDSGVTIPLKTFKYPIDISTINTSETTGLAANDRIFDADIYTFYFISQWTERKNFTDLLDAYWAEFQWGEKVRLILKTHLVNRDASEEQALLEHIKRLQERGIYHQLPETHLVTQLLSQDQMTELHRRCDCYVSPSHGEGLGLGILDAGLAGKPVVTHLFGEQSSYVNADNALIYGYSLRPVINMLPNPRYSADQRWAQPDLHDMAKQMRFCFENRQVAHAKGARLKQHLIKVCESQQVVQEILTELSTSLARFQVTQNLPLIPANVVQASSLEGAPVMRGQQVQATPVRDVQVAPTPTVQAPSGDTLTAIELLTAALQHFQAGQLAAAEQCCQQILQQQPHQPQALYILGAIAFQHDKLAEAVAHWKTCLALNPSNAADVYSDLGFVLIEQGNVDEGTAYLQQAIALNPNHFIAHTNLGNTRREQGRLNEALEHLQVALTLNPSYAPTHHDLGLALMEQGNLDLATVHLQQAIALDSSDADSHYNLGQVWQKRGKRDEAIASYQAAIALDPNHVMARTKLNEREFDSAI